MPTTISSTTRPRSSRTISWRARVWTALSFSSLGRSRCSSAARSKRASGEGDCSQIRRNTGRSAGMRQASAASSTPLGTTRFQRSAMPRSMMKARPTTEVASMMILKKISIVVVVVNQQILDQFFNKRLFVPESKSDIQTVFGIEPAHVARPRSIRRRVCDGEFTNGGKEVANIAANNVNVRDAPIRTQRELHGHLPGAILGKFLAIQQIPPMRGDGVDQFAIIFAEGGRNRVKRRSLKMPVHAAFLPHLLARYRRGRLLLHCLQQSVRVFVFGNFCFGGLVFSLAITWLRRGFGHGEIAHFGTAFGFGLCLFGGLLLGRRSFGSRRTQRHRF